MSSPGWCIGPYGDIEVVVGQRRRGIGTALYQVMAAWLRGQGIKHIERDFAMENEVATSFWRE
jgi:hypothetical protein